MTSAIDPTRPAQGALASKAEMRANFAAAKTEIEALQDLQVRSVQPSLRFKEDFGAVADGVTDNTTAFLSAIGTSAAQGRMLLLGAPGDVFFLQTTTVQRINDNVAGNVDIEGGGAILKFSANHLIGLNASAGIGSQIVADMARGDFTFELTDAIIAAGVVPGNQVRLLSGTIPTEAGGITRYRQSHVAIVRAVNGTVITLWEPTPLPLLLEHGGVQASFRVPRSFAMRNVTIEFINNASNLALSMSRFSKVRLENIKIRGTQEIRDGEGFAIGECMDLSADRLHVENVNYGFVLSMCNHVKITNLYAFNCFHPITPSAYCRDVLVQDAVMIKCHGGMDAHECFDVHYDRIDFRDLTAAPNIRAFGARLTNARIQMREDVAVRSAAFGSNAHYDPTLARFYTCEIRNVIVEGAGAAGLTFGIEACGNLIVFDHIDAPNCNIRAAAQGQILKISNSRIATARCWLPRFSINDSEVVYNAGAPTSTGAEQSAFYGQGNASNLSWDMRNVYISGYASLFYRLPTINTVPEGRLLMHGCTLKNIGLFRHAGETRTNVRVMATANIADCPGTFTTDFAPFTGPLVSGNVGM